MAEKVKSKFSLLRVLLAVPISIAALIVILLIIVFFPRGKIKAYQYSRIFVSPKRLKCIQGCI